MLPGFDATPLRREFKKLMLRAFAAFTASDAATARNKLNVVDIQPIDATVAANALTVTINPTNLDFRSATITSGAVNNRTIPVAISCVVPNTATLGTSSTFASRIAVLAIDNAGVEEVAVVNAAGGLRLDGTNLISTTALSTASDLANVIYSTTARTNVPYRVAGYFDITEAIAGTWATAPSKIQGAGGDLESVSVRRWRNVIGSRSAGVIYTVGWDEPERDVRATAFSSAGMLLSFYVYPAGEIAAGVEVMAPQVLANVNCTVGGKVSPGDSYQVVQSAGAITLYRWAERN